jgi:hypothetical protein
MTLQNLRIVRLTLGVTAAVGVSYGIAWPLSYLAPVFAFMFLALPKWVGWKNAVKLLCLLGATLVIGIAISEFLLDFPLVCASFYGLLLFTIYYYDTPAAPPMSTLFMTLSVTIIPIVGFLGEGTSSMIAMCLLFNMGGGLVFAGLFHTLLPNPKIIQQDGKQITKSAESPAPQPEAERIRLAFTSASVAFIAVMLFFAFNLAQHALVMVFVCFMAGSPCKNASLAATKLNSTACLIGGIAVIIAFNLLVAVPNFHFLLAVTLAFSLFFSRKIYGDGPYAAAFSSGFSTFLILLGSSTGIDKVASANFYLRIAQILSAGLFSIFALMVVEHLLRPQNWLFFRITKKIRTTVARRSPSP